MNAKRISLLGMLLIVGSVWSLTSCGGGLANSPQATNPTPSLFSLSPSSATTGASDLTLTVTGSNFIATSVVRWNGLERPTTFVSSTALTAAIPAADIASAGTANVTVFNPAPGGGASSAATFTVNNPAPSISSLSPSTGGAGGPAFTLSVIGSNFVPGSVVQWNGLERATTFVSSTALTAAIPAGDVADGGIVEVSVFNAAPGGGTSSAVSFTIVNPSPSLSSLSPSTGGAGGPAFTLSVIGSNFVPGSVVQWNGLERATTFVSSTALTAAIPADDAVNGGIAGVSVFNAAPGGGTSSVVSFTIINPSPSIDSLYPRSIAAGSGSFSLRVYGWNFVPSSRVQWNGSDRPTSFDIEELIADIPAEDVANVGTANVTVFNPEPGGGSTTIPFTISVSVTVSPQSVGVVRGRTRLFSASVPGPPGTGINWTVEEGDAGGSITAEGLYTAPQTLGTFHVIATSTFDPNNATAATVTVVEKGFVATGPMNAIRRGHTATLLPNGNVLIAGGMSLEGEALSSAELFDPSTGQFRATGSMGDPRFWATATLLPSGKVLIVGGFEGSVSVATAELYDPATGTFSPTGDMTTARYSHTATLLPDGKVLVTGGWYVGNHPFPLDSAETYDPAVGAFSFTNSMAYFRGSHTATLLGDGRVLVAGGSDGCSSLVSAEIFDPAEGAFANTAGMAGSRLAHTATLLPDGRVLMAGGREVDCQDPSSSYLNTAEVFDPGTSTFSGLPNISEVRSGHTATLLPNGQVLLAGGVNGNPSSAELFDPVNSNFAITGSMEKERSGHAATLLQDGRVLITGGSGDTSTEIFE